jgi:hypothetical protein
MKTPITLTLDARALMAARLFTSTDNVRYTLMGVLVEIPDEKTVRLVATDARRLFAISLSTEVLGFEEPTQFIIPNHLIDMVPDTQSATFMGVRCSFFGADSVNRVPSVCFDFGIGSDSLQLKAPCVDGIYPNWRQAVEGCYPRQLSGEYFNPALLVDFSRAASLLAKKNPSLALRLWNSGAGKPMVVETGWGGYDVLAILNPMRIHASTVKADAQAPAVPEWSGISERNAPEPAPWKSALRRLFPIFGPKAAETAAD